VRPHGALGQGLVESAAGSRWAFGSRHNDEKEHW